MVDTKLLNAFRRIRKAHWACDVAFFGNRSFCRTADHGLIKARAMVADGKAPTYTVQTFPTVQGGNRINRQAERNRDAVYFEKGEFSRFEYSDEVMRLRHTGWLPNDHGDIYRGVAIQLSGSKGKPRYIAGYEESINGGFIVDLTSVTDDQRSAASWGDSMAERSAEKEREYHDAWSEGLTCGNDLQDALADIETALQRFRARRDAPLGSHWRKEARLLVSTGLDDAKMRRDDALQTKADNWHNEAFREGFAT